MLLSIMDSAAESKTAVIIAPHADDETLDAGGVIAVLSAAGWEIHVLFATISGYPSMWRENHSTTPDREQEVQAAMKTLGVDSYKSLYRGEEKHLRLDTVPQTEIIGFLENQITQIRPSIAVIPCRGHYHQDHRALSDACVAAMRPAPDCSNRPFVPLVLAYGHSALGWGGELFAFRPSVFVDISGHIDKKLAALECYQSQVFAPPHPRSIEKVKLYSATWGSHAGVEYAEPFECLRLVLR